MPTPAQRPARQRPAMRGFTLIEVLVAITVLAIMAVMSWRAIDGMTRAQDHARLYADEVLALNAAIAQWKTDLDQQITPLDSAKGTAAAEPTPMLWDGQSMRITRRTGSGTDAALHVVAWTRHVAQSGVWMRWQSEPVRTVGAWRDAWSAAARWAQGSATSEPTQATRLTGLDDWQLSYYRGGAWTNAMSAGTTQVQTGDENAGTQVTTQAQGQVDGVRLVLQLPPGPAFAGTVTVDWVRPTRGGGR